MLKTTGLMVALAVAAIIILQPLDVPRAVGLGMFLAFAFALGLFHKV